MKRLWTWMLWGVPLGAFLLWVLVIKTDSLALPLLVGGGAAVCILAFRRGGGDPLTRWQKVKCGLLLFAIFGTIVLFRYQMTATRIPVVLDRLTGQVCWGFDSVSCSSFAQSSRPDLSSYGTPVGEQRSGSPSHNQPTARLQFAGQSNGASGPWTKYQQAPAPARSTN